MIVDNYIYGVKLGGWLTNVANGTKTRNRWKMLQMVCYSTKGSQSFITYGKKLGEWSTNVRYGMKLDGWRNNATYGIKL